MHSIDYVEVNTNQNPNSSVIWLHGLGADGHDFEGIVSELRLPEKLGVRFIFPHAPIQPVSINGGYPMRSWFDILGIDETAAMDEPGIRKSQQSIEHLIEGVIEKGIPSDRIVLGGFSQGGALALYLGLRYSKKLAGVVGLSTFLPLANQLLMERKDINDKTPVFLGHGTLDDVVPYRLGKVTYDALKRLNYPVSWHEYEMPHTVNNIEVKDISRWMQQVLVV